MIFDRGEFPLLHKLGLYAKNTAGNGNCLFHALSDQLYGHQYKHKELRARVITHMRARAEHYKQFIDVRPASCSQNHRKQENADIPSPGEINRAFEKHLLKMARGGTYGDNMELSAFSEALNVDIRIYQRDLTYLISTKVEGNVVPVLHIAYHTWEHYSSVRNRCGPHNGHPRIQSMGDFFNKEQRKKKLWQERKARKKLARMSSECRQNIDASVFKLRDAKLLATTVKTEDTKEPTSAAKDRQTSKEPTAAAKDHQTSKEPASLAENSQIPQRRSDGDGSTDQPRKKRRRRLINRAERDKLLTRLPVRNQKLRKRTPMAKPLLREVCI